MKSYHWLLATLLVLCFCVFYLFFDGVQNIGHVDKMDEPASDFIDIQKSSVLFRNKSSMENCFTYSYVNNGLFKT